MNKAIKRIRLQTFLLVLIEFILLTVAGVLYIFNLGNVKQYLNEETVVLLAGITFIVNMIYLVIQITIVGRIRNKSDLQSTELLGGDIIKAYEFAALGLVVVDNDNNIIWTSDLFTDRNIDILDKNISSWLPQLESLIITSDQVDGDIEDTIKVEISSRNYQVKFLREAGLFLFKDITELEYLFEENKMNASVVGIIMIDNFMDMVARREISNPMIAIITSSIFDYCRKFGILVRQYRDDSFILLMNYRSYQLVYADKFSFMETVRNREENKEIRMTLSAAFAYNFPELMKLSDLAVTAIDTAIARGGDQVVISRHGDENEYIGGASAASEKRNRTAIRLKADTLFAKIREASNVLIMGHTDTDLDALGSALGLKSIADYLKTYKYNSKDAKKVIPARVVYNPNITESKTKNAVTSLFTKDEVNKIFITPQQLMSEKGPNSLVNQDTLLIICDISRPSMVIDPRLLDRVEKVIVIDHHRRTDDFIETPIYDYIDTTASSTSEMVSELIYYGNTPDYKLESKYATFMLAGIYLDTNYFRANTTGSRTFMACMTLEESGADVTLADDFLKDEYEEYILITRIMNSISTFSLGVTIAKASDNDIVDNATLAKVANQSMRIKGVQASFVIGLTSAKDVKISARSDGSFNVQLILEKLGGGGHQASAAALIKDSTIKEVEDKLKYVLEQYLNEARSRK